MPRHGEIKRKMIPHLNGIAIEITYDNGYGASVICHEGSYGGKHGLFELAVLKDGELCYDSGITEDVIGYQDFGEIAELLDRISKLPRKD